ncbi:hypothetical protein BV97_02260 [Novosphingobium resinovorum]|uniref:Uncharacterized protein n=1 Tax=Novosphingobium resinovorum TaxID=158500 RepID=A0A031K0U6_9SPHN|nr:hypothetical protein BV97_02260 [Novosphingobium resinovorum]
MGRPVTRVGRPLKLGRSGYRTGAPPERKGLVRWTGKTVFALAAASRIDRGQIRQNPLKFFCAPPFLA